MTGVATFAEARRVHVADVLPVLELVDASPVVDVGSGTGSPGIPIAASRPDLRVDLLEASRRKCAFLEAVAARFGNVSVVCARAEEHGRDAGRDAYGVAVARALAPPRVAAEWCLPLVRPGGCLLLLAGAVEDGLERVAAALAAAPPETIRDPKSVNRRILVFQKLGPTPARFPRRPGVARKRPLG
jgi:16S rRNA (guanine527-N7)-methyltransferase